MTTAQGEARIRHRLLVSEYLGRFWTVDVWSSLNNDTLWLEYVLVLVVLSAASLVCLRLTELNGVCLYIVM